jgi:hypothetical protein
LRKRALKGRENGALHTKYEAGGALSVGAARVSTTSPLLLRLTRSVFEPVASPEVISSASPPAAIQAVPEEGMLSWCEPDESPGLARPWPESRC